MTRSKTILIVIALAPVLLVSCAQILTETLVQDPINYELNKKPTNPTGMSHREAKEKEKNQQELMKAGKCPDCNGIGKTPDGKNTCLTCNGTGKYSSEK